LHPLTKIFVVLQALLSVLVAALVIPLAVNNNTWKTRWNEADARAKAAEAAADLSVGIAGRSEAAATQKLQSIESEKQQLLATLAQRQTEIVELRSQLAAAQQAAAAISAQIETLTATTQTQANIVKTQGDEITRRRDESLELHKNNIELQDSLRDTMTKLDAALEAQKVLQEQLASVNEQLDSARSMGSMMAANTQTEEPAVIASPMTVGRVLRVDSLPSGERLVEIDLGTRDGLAQNMKFLVHRNGAFMGNLFITSVDVNRAVGRVDLEQAGGVQVGDLVQGGISN